MAAARAGRVSHTGFLDPDEAAQLVQVLRSAGVAVHVSGGYPGARRRIVTVFPDNIPEATTSLNVWFVAGVHDPQDLETHLRQVVQPEQLGDIIIHQDGCSAVVLAKAKSPESLRLRGQDYPVQQVELAHVVTGKSKRQQVIVPSLRVDALGAKAFGVSRSYFGKGIAAGNVMLNGRKASKSSDAEAGDEIYAEGLGRFTITAVQGETRRGNLKVMLEIERA